jgi:hypothetical protein
LKGFWRSHSAKMPTWYDKGTSHLKTTLLWLNGNKLAS